MNRPTRFDRAAAFRAGVILVPLFELLGGWMARVSGSTEANVWYQTLAISPLQPHGVVFGIAWSVLYALIAIAAAIVWGHKHAAGRSFALGLFGLQLGLNLAWSPLFFRQHQILPAFILLLLIWLISVWTTFKFAPISRLAAWLLVPYLIWLSFASGLSFTVWQLNPGAGQAISAIFAP